MLTSETRLRIQTILKRLAKGDEVTLQERILINKYSKRNQNVSAWLRKALKIQQNKNSSNPIDQLIESLNVGSLDPNDIYNPEHEDLGDWFSGAPSWIRRS